MVDYNYNTIAPPTHTYGVLNNVLTPTINITGHRPVYMFSLPYKGMTATRPWLLVSLLSHIRTHTPGASVITTSDSNIRNRSIWCNKNYTDYTLRNV